MGFVVVAPPAPLSDWIESIWDWDMPQQAHRLERMLPSACAQLTINLAEDETRVYDDALNCVRGKGASLDAPSHRSFVIDTAEQVSVCGAVFKPGAAAPLFRIVNCCAAEVALTFVFANCFADGVIVRPFAATPSPTSVVTTVPPGVPAIVKRPVFGPVLAGLSWIETVQVVRPASVAPLQVPPLAVNPAPVTVCVSMPVGSSPRFATVTVIAGLIAPTAIEPSSTWSGTARKLAGASAMPVTGALTLPPGAPMT